MSAHCRHLPGDLAYRYALPVLHVVKQGIGKDAVRDARCKDISFQTHVAGFLPAGPRSFVARPHLLRSARPLVGRAKLSSHTTPSSGGEASGEEAEAEGESDHTVCQVETTAYPGWHRCARVTGSPSSGRCARMAPRHGATKSSSALAAVAATISSASLHLYPEYRKTIGTALAAPTPRRTTPPPPPHTLMTLMTLMTTLMPVTALTEML